MQKLRLTVLISAAAALCAAAVYDSSIFASLQWRSIGPPRGGRSIASAGSPSRPNEYYFGAAGGGLWKTTDGGLTWRPVTDGQLQSSSVGAVAVSESNPDVVYIGMGETELRGNIMQGDGVYKSTDAGKTWKHVGLADTQAISRIRVHPTNPDIVYVSALGPSLRRERGARRLPLQGRRRRPGRRSSSATTAPAPSISASTRTIRNVLYAAIWDAYRTPWSLSSGGPASGLFKIHRRRRHWTEITRNPGLPAGHHRQDRRRGLRRRFQSRLRHRGERKRRRVRLRRRAAPPGRRSARIAACASAPSTTRASTPTRRRRTRCTSSTPASTNPPTAARPTAQLRTPHGDNHDLWIDPTNPQRMIEQQRRRRQRLRQRRRDLDRAGVPDRAALSRGHHARHSVSRLRRAAGQLHHLRLERRRPGRGGRGGTRAVRGGRRRERLHRARIPPIPNLFYAGSQGALLTRFDRRTGYTRDIQVYPLFFSGESAGLAEGALAVDLPHRLLARWIPTCSTPRSQHLWKTTDDGHSWQKITPDLTRDDPKTLGDSGGPITHDQNGPEIYGTIFTIAPSRKETGHHLDRLRRWPGLHHARRRQELDQSHAARHARFRPRQPDRRLAATIPARPTSR